MICETSVAVRTLEPNVDKYTAWNKLRQTKSNSSNLRRAQTKSEFETRNNEPNENPKSNSR